MRRISSQRATLLNPFWVVQFRMIPLVLYNQLVVWPLVYLILLWPIWSKTHLSESEWSSRYGIWTLPPAWLALAIISDQMWYWSHRLMHVPFAWKHYHRMHHIAEQCALSATYVHAVEYALFTFALGLPFALAGFPVYFHAVSLAWGMFTGSGEIEPRRWDVAENIWLEFPELYGSDDAPKLGEKRVDSIAVKQKPA